MSLNGKVNFLLASKGLTIVSGTPEGYDSVVLAALARAAWQDHGEGSDILFIVRDDQRLRAAAEALAFFAPDVAVLRFPAWDCLPYDRVSPAASIVAERIATLAQLTSGRSPGDGPRIVLATVNAATQRVPPREAIKGAALRLAPGHRMKLDCLQAYLTRNGFSRTGTVLEAGEYAVRGGIVDIFPSGASGPLRLDFFGDALETIRSFDPQSQRTTGQERELLLQPANEVLLTDTTIAAFRTRYAATFSGTRTADPLYEAVSAGRRYQGMEHWLPLFYTGLETLFDYGAWRLVAIDHLAADAAVARREQVEEFYSARLQAREQGSFGAAPYNPLEPKALYLPEDEWADALAAQPNARFSPFEHPESGAATIVSLGGRQGRNFAAERAREGADVFSALHEHIAGLSRSGRKVVIACWSDGARERMRTILLDHEIAPLAVADRWSEVEARHRAIIDMIVLGVEAGFETPELALISEQDILGDRLIRRARKARKASDFIAELSSLTPGDLVVHVDHGIGRFEGLKAIEVQGAPHDCLFIVYHGGDRLFLPVENIELLSRYGADDAGVQLDRLGGSGWQARKSRMKKRLREMADALIKTAAARALRTGDVISPQDGLHQEFSARFPYEETEDQQDAIDSVIEDLQSGRPMDRLICGDVGFGKTEVALRAAFATALSGRQVAVVVPTTLLARQHYETFVERFRGYPVRIEQISRLVGRKRINDIRRDVEAGGVDIVIGTHALLSQGVQFRNLGLLIIDEEQHFGVKHKERLKEMRANVHVLTLTATPIPRTLQLALTGVRDLSLITTPPLDRLAVRTFITPFDPVIVREALLRELYRGGQSFYVCPRISDLDEARQFIAEHIPEVKVAVAHGRMPPGQLEDIMSAFYDRKYDVLLSTTIIESGLDIPTANTLVVHRADMFGLAQLYQLRGRVGRSKQRAYALFTVPVNKPMTPGADKRLRVLQSLDSLGAGFSLASHDLDIRGAGNLLGEEQSGHIKEVGFELYQQMLEEAVAQLRAGGADDEVEDKWSPQINIGTAVLIPETFVADLDVRLALYRRLADLSLEEEIQGFAAELRDRFGPLPSEVEHLLQVVSIKILCRQANVASVDAGPKGVVFAFRKDTFANPAGLVGYLNEQAGLAKLRPDHRLVVKRNMDLPEERLKGVRAILGRLSRIAGEAAEAA